MFLGKAADFNFFFLMIRAKPPVWSSINIWTVWLYSCCCLAESPHCVINILVQLMWKNIKRFQQGK